MRCGHGDGAKYRRWVGGPIQDFGVGCSICDYIRRYGKAADWREAFCSDPSCHRALDDEGPLCSVCKAEGLEDSL